MVDFADDAQFYAEHHTKVALENHRLSQKTGDGTTHCEDCGEKIPEGRKKVAPSCTRCVTCQAKAE